MIQRRPIGGGGRHRRHLLLTAPLQPLFGALAVATLLPLAPVTGVVPGGTIAPVNAAEATTSSVLERIDYRHNGQEQQSVGELEIQGDRVRIRLFSEQLANHYEIWVTLDDFIGAVPLGADAAEAVLAEREARIAARKVEQEEARKRRLAKRAAEKETEAKRWGGRPNPSSSKSDDKNATSTPVSASAADLLRLEKNISDRRDTALERAGKLLDEIAVLLPDARTRKRTLRSIAATIEEAEGSLGKISSGLAARRNALDRIDVEIAEGTLRGRALREQIEYVADHYGRIETKLAKVESAIETSARALAQLPDEPPPPPPEEEPEKRVAVGEGAAETDAKPHGSARRVAEASTDLGAGAVAEPAFEVRDATVERSAARKIDEEGAPEESEMPEPDAEAPDAEEPGSKGQYEAENASEGGGRMPVWPLYPVGLLSLFFLWRGTRKTA